MPNTETTISYTSILRVLIIALAAFVVYLIRDVLAMLFVAIIFSAAVDPTVDWLQKRKIPRSVSVLLIYAILLLITTLVILAMIPPLTEQIGQLIEGLPRYMDKISTGINTLRDQTAGSGVAGNSFTAALESLSNNLAEATKSVFVTITGVFGGLFSLLTVLIITFYLVVQENALKDFFRFIMPPKHRTYTMKLIERMQSRIGLWLRGQLLLSLIVGALVYVALTIAGVKYALLLGLIAGITEIIPYIGPWLGAIPGVLVATMDSWKKVLIVIIIYVVIQQLENGVIVPTLMKKVIGLNPIIVILSVMIGIKVGGILGGLVGVPVAAAISVYFSDILEMKRASHRTG